MTEEIKARLRQIAEIIDSEVLNRLKTGNHKINVDSFLFEEKMLLKELRNLESSIN